MFSACKTYEKQLRIEKTRLSHQVWSHGGSTFKKKRTLNGHFSRPAETDPYVYCVSENYSRIKRFHPLCWTILLRLMTRQEQAPELLSSFLKFHGSKIQEDFSNSANSIQINPQQCLCIKLECDENILYLLPFPNP